MRARPRVRKGPRVIASTRRKHLGRSLTTQSDSFRLPPRRLTPAPAVPDSHEAGWPACPGFQTGRRWTSQDCWPPCTWLALPKARSEKQRRGTSGRGAEKAPHAHRSAGKPGLKETNAVFPCRGPRTCQTRVGVRHDREGRRVPGPAQTYPSPGSFSSRPFRRSLMHGLYLRTRGMYYCFPSQSGKVLTKSKPHSAPLCSPEPSVPSLP